MGNTTPGGIIEEHQRRFPRREESFGSKSPSSTSRITIKNGNNNQRINQNYRYSHQSQSSQRSQSLEYSAAHSPSSSRSSSSNTNTTNTTNSFINSINSLNNTNNCLRQNTEPMFAINGDLNPHQIGLIKRAWKNLLKSVGEDENEIAVKLLLRIFQLDSRNLDYFSLNEFCSNPFDEYLIRENNVFICHVKTFESTLINIMTHPGNATKLSKHLQQLGGRHVNYTGVTYKCSYWKCFIQSLIDILTLKRENCNKNTSEDLIEAILILGEFCVEQMKIGYKIEYKLQCEAEKLAKIQKRRKNKF
uniref:Globin domain-containing protein n=1 Tax=Meloidogyne enterolobii TaxID=390850 RepID=A0A6V7X0T6_MELEN|nr:unnamed protein product [Meloidogyne enterolobii]